MASLVSTFEESDRQGGFPAQSPKAQTWNGTKGDEAGLSYGLFQFTHKSGRLGGLLRRSRDNPPATNQALFDQVFAVPGTTIDGLFDHLTNFAAQTTHGIAKPAFAAYDLYKPAWEACFLDAGQTQVFQICQVAQAVEDLKTSYRLMKVNHPQDPGGYAPLLTNERGIGFWLDLANQMGDGGARTRYKKVVQQLGGTPTQDQILDKVVADSSFKARRQYFRSFAPLTNPGDPFAGA